MRQNVVAVDGHVVFAERLAHSRAQAGQNLLLAELCDAVDFQVGDLPLRPLVDVDRHGNLVLLPLIFILHVGGDLDIAKAVLLVQVGDGFFIPPKIAPAIAAAAELQGSGIEIHSLANGRRVEIAVAGDVELDQLVARAQIHNVIDLRLVAEDPLRLEFDLGVKIPLRLKIISQVTLAFHQQIAVDGMLLEDRNESFQLSTGDFRPHGGNGNLGSGANVEGGLDGAGIFVELHFFERHPGH